MTHLAFAAGIAAIAASSLWTADDPFVGKWKLDVSRSVIVDQMAVESAGPNKYTFKFEGGPAETILADGTDQPGLPGTTLSVKADGSRTLNVVRKQDGRIIISAVWNLSEDGRTLRDTFSGIQPDGSTITVDYLYKRMSGTSGFVGVWESTTPPFGLNFELKIQPFGGDGFSFDRQGSVKNIKFDGQEHAVEAATAGDTAAGRRQNERTLEITDRKAGKVADTQLFTVSPDNKTLTIDVRKTGQTTPERFVFARE